MTETNLVLMLLAAALMHAIWNAVVKFEGKKVFILSMVDGTAMFLGMLLIPFVSIPEKETWFYLAASVVLNILYRVFLLKAYELGDFSRIYPLVRGLPPLLVTIMAVVLLQERISNLNMLGIALVSCGIISMMAGKFDFQAKTITFSFFSGFCIAIYTIIDGVGIRLSNDVFSYIVWFTVLENMPFPLFVSLFRRREFCLFVRKSYGKGLIGGGTAAAGYGIVLWAMTFANLGSVSALRESSILFATLIGVFIFKEGLGLRKILASTSMVIGIFLVHLAL